VNEESLYTVAAHSDDEISITPGEMSRATVERILDGTYSIRLDELRLLLAVERARERPQK
jgi:hypothetical protein